MAGIEIREMTDNDATFVSTCSHVNESEEIDACAARRRVLFDELKAHGGTFKVALQGNEHIGFAYGIPIEHASWGPLGAHLMTIPCLFVVQPEDGQGAGRALIESVEQEAREAGHTGVSVTAYREIPGAEWFMPSSFFEHLGYTPVDTRGREVLLWKTFSADAQPPHFLQPHFVFEPVEGAVVVDLFWNGFCQTSAIEAHRVREVCSEFGNSVLLREFQAEDREILLRYQIPRAIYVNGEEIGWGFEAPKDGIRAAIQEQLDALD